MGTFRRRSFRAPVRHNKEIFDGVFIGVAAGTITDVEFATAINAYAGGIGTCPISAKIKAVWMDVSYTSGSESPSRMDWLVQVNPTGLGGNLITPGSTGGDVDRKLVFLERKGLNNTVGSGTGNNPRAQAGWLMIPKRYQNMSEGQSFHFRASGSALYDLCVKFIYKWVA